MRPEVTLLSAPSPASLPLEIVERKGVGHPDTICDALAEHLSVALSRIYLERFGALQHHNVDKGLLWGGAARPAFGGGEMCAPIELRHDDSVGSARTVSPQDPESPGVPLWSRASRENTGPSPAGATLQRLTRLRSGHDASRSSSTRAAVGEAAVDADDTVAVHFFVRRKPLTRDPPGNSARQ